MNCRPPPNLHPDAGLWHSAGLEHHCPPSAAQMLQNTKKQNSVCCRDPGEPAHPARSGGARATLVTSAAPPRGTRTGATMQGTPSFAAILPPRPAEPAESPQIRRICNRPVVPQGSDRGFNRPCALHPFRGPTVRFLLELPLQAVKLIPGEHEVHVSISPYTR